MHEPVPIRYNPELKRGWMLVFDDVAIADTRRDTYETLVVPGIYASPENPRVSLAEALERNNVVWEPQSNSYRILPTPLGL